MSGASITDYKTREENGRDVETGIGGVFASDWFSDGIEALNFISTCNPYDNASFEMDLSRPWQVPGHNWRWMYSEVIDKENQLAFVRASTQGGASLVVVIGTVAVL